MLDFTPAGESFCAGAPGSSQNDHRPDHSSECGTSCRRAGSAVAVERPNAFVRTDPVPALQRLGLTPAEARIAALVGGGLSPSSAAQQLGSKQNTDRSALRVVYDKLEIQKQSELAMIVTRLDGLGDWLSG